MRKLLLCCALALGTGCRAPQPVPGGDQLENHVTASDLSTSLEVRPGADSVGFRLHVTNASGQPVTLEFANGQRYDFVVQQPDGREVWRWGDDMMFTEVLGRETLQPGASVSYTARWQPGGRSGAFVAVGRVTASNRTIEQRVNFELPKK